MTKQDKEYNKVEVDVKVNDEKVEEVVIEEKEPLKQVTKAKPRKKGLTERLVVGLIGNAEQDGALKYIGKEIIMPSIKDLSYNAIQSLASSLLYGQDGQQAPRNSTYSTRGPAQRTNYQGAYGTKPTAPSKPRNVRQEVEDYILETRQDAVIVLDSLIDQCQRYGSVSIADYYDLVGVDSTYTQGKYGWSDLSRARIITNRHGFTIAFPPVELI